MRRTLLLALHGGWLAGWLAGCLAGCMTADAMTPAPSKPNAVAANSELGLNPGETMAFEVSLGGIVAGEAQLAVGQLGDFEGKPAIVVTSRAATVGAADLLKHVVDEATSVIEVATGRPLKLDTNAETGDKQLTSHAVFTATRVEATYKRSDDAHPRTFKIDSGKQQVYEGHSAMAQLRGWRPSAGTTKSIFIVGGRRLWRVDVKLVGYETVGSALGNRRAVHFEGASYKARGNLTIESDKPGRTFQVWLSDDADRVPLKVTASTELGDIALTLTDYQRP